MCGVAGLFYRNERAVSPGTVSNMMQTIMHRGPDDSGQWTEGSIGLGHRRLSIRDLTSAGQQPLCDPSGRIYVSYNGEIYNDAALRQILTRDFGCQFHTNCDTEILPSAYLAWGERMFEKLEGMFAIALWDRKESKLLLARDGIGIKPLYYHCDAKTVRFASEIKALLSDPEQPRELSVEGLHRLFAMGYAGPDTTTFKTIRLIPPGTVMAITAKTVTFRKFWTPTRKPDLFNFDDALSEFASIWSTVVKDQLVSDVPIGVLQSGGIDSTLVSLEANRTTKTPLFTASFPKASFDEYPAAMSVARHLDTDIYKIEVQSHANIAETLSAVVHHYDGQICDEASVPLYLLSKAVRQHVTVALSGDG